MNFVAIVDESSSGEKSKLFETNQTRPKKFENIVEKSRIKSVDEGSNQSSCSSCSSSSNFVLLLLKDLLSIEEDAIIQYLIPTDQQVKNGCVFINEALLRT